MTNAPAQLTKADSGGWTLWEKLAEGRPEFGNPAAFNRCIAQSCWESFTVTLKNPDFFDQMIQFSGNEPGTGGLVTFKDSNWLMSIVLAINLISRTSQTACRCSGDTRCFRTGSAISFPSRWRSAMARRSAGTVRPPAIRSRDGCVGELHSLQNAVHHEYVHATRAQ
jgi:hypothetical protein